MRDDDWGAMIDLGRVVAGIGVSVVSEGEEDVDKQLCGKPIDRLPFSVKLLPLHLEFPPLDRDRILQPLHIVQNLLEICLPRSENFELRVDDTSIFVDGALPAPGHSTESESEKRYATGGNRVGRQKLLSRGDDV
jgi:hypothetical protein